MSFPVPNELPRSDSPALLLAQANDAEKIAAWTLNSDHWGGQFPLHDYIRRREHSAIQALAVTYWILVHEDDTSNPRCILASCETFRKRALVASQSGDLEEVICHGVGMVFCRKQLRRRGYAGRMVVELKKKLASWNQDTGIQTRFSILYSDLPKEYYGSRGWRSFPATGMTLPPANSNASKPQHARAFPKPYLAPLCRVDEALLRTRLAQPSPSSSGVRVAVVPDLKTMQWHHAREEFGALYKLDKKPHMKGAVVGDEGCRVWAVWTRKFPWEDKGGPGVLFILRLAFEGDAQDERGKGEEIVPAVKEVLKMAQMEAREWDMERVEIWNPSPVVQRAAKELCKDAQVVERENDDIPSLLWYGEKEGEVEWVANEKYAWC